MIPDRESRMGTKLCWAVVLLGVAIVGSDGRELQQYVASILVVSVLITALLCL